MRCAPASLIRRLRNAPAARPTGSSISSRRRPTSSGVIVSHSASSRAARASYSASTPRSASSSAKGSFMSLSLGQAASGGAREIFLQRCDPEALGLEQALEVFARIDEAAGAQHALLIDERRKRQAAHLEGKAERR